MNVGSGGNIPEPPSAQPIIGPPPPPNNNNNKEKVIEFLDNFTGSIVKEEIDVNLFSKDELA